MSFEKTENIEKPHSLTPIGVYILLSMCNHSFEKDFFSLRKQSCFRFYAPVSSFLERHAVCSYFA